MPASKGAPPTDPPAPPAEEPAAPAPKPAAPAPAPVEKETAAPETLPGRLAPGPAEYIAPVESVYLSVPLTARPATDERPATVFDWPEGAPDDGRWKPTKATPNQLPDNAPAEPVKEG